MSRCEIDTRSMQDAWNVEDTDFCIRRASLADVEIVAELGSRTFQDSYGSDNDPGTMKHYLASSFSPEQIASELAAPTAIFLLVCRGSYTIGYAKLDVENFPDCVSGPKPIRLVRMYMEQGYIGNGYGAALMKSCLEESCRAGYKTIWLGVWEQNKRAQRFYQNQGFHPVGSLDFIFGREIQKDVIMAKDIAKGG
jgi:ribosomal protein S18 acetylase RimI-like enzyme